MKKHGKGPRMSARKRRLTLLEMFLGLLLAIVVLAPVAWMFLSSVMLPVPAKRSSARGASPSKSM